MYIERCKTFKKHFKEIAKVKFKKMTQKQRDYGKIIAIAVLSAIMLIGALSSCTVYRAPQMKITSVLAVTAEGDTLKLPIDVIRPIYNYNTYPTNRYPIGYGHNTFYYTPWRNHSYNGNDIIIRNGNGSNSNNPNISQSGSGPNVASPAVVTPPSNPPNPARTNPRKNN